MTTQALIGALQARGLSREAAAAYCGLGLVNLQETARPTVRPPLFRAWTRP